MVGMDGQPLTRLSAWLVRMAAQPAGTYYKPEHSSNSRQSASQPASASLLAGRLAGWVRD